MDESLKIALYLSLSISSGYFFLIWIYTKLLFDFVNICLFMSFNLFEFYYL